MNSSTLPEIYDVIVARRVAHRSEICCYAGALPIPFQEAFQNGPGREWLIAHRILMKFDTGGMRIAEIGRPVLRLSFPERMLCC